MIANKIKPGTAARLGLRPPVWPLLGVITHRDPMAVITAEEFLCIKDRFTKAKNENWQFVYEASVAPERLWWRRWLR